MSAGKGDFPRHNITRFGQGHTQVQWGSCKWTWKMAFCAREGLSPADTDNWLRAEAAWLKHARQPVVYK